MSIKSNTAVQAIMDTAASAAIATILWKNREVMSKNSKWAIAGAVICAIGEGFNLTKGITRSRIREIHAIRADQTGSLTSLMAMKVLQVVFNVGFTGFLARYSSSIPRLSAFLFGGISAGVAFTPLNEFVGFCQDPLPQL